MKPISMRLSEQARIVSVFLHLVFNGKIKWLAYLYQNRWRFQAEALFIGVRQNISGKSSEYNFRRNIHRIEKGLSNAIIKPVFAEKYIFETVKLHRILRMDTNSGDNTIKWGEAVLAHYFSQVQHTVVIQRSYEYYIESKPENLEPTWFPYSIEDRPDTDITLPDLHNLALKRRSIRTYQDKLVDYSLIKQAMTVASLSPSACNRQPFRFLYYDDPKVVRDISQIPGGVSGYWVPSILVVIGSYGAYFDERDLNCPIIDASLAAMSFLLALETLGLSSVCINWPNLPNLEEKIRQIIKLAPEEFIVMLIGVGYAAENARIPFSAKKNIDELIQQNQRLNAGYQGSSSTELSGDLE
jgi:nitroreductase